MAWMDPEQLGVCHFCEGTFPASVFRHGPDDGQIVCSESCEKNLREKNLREREGESVWDTQLRVQAEAVAQRAQAEAMEASRRSNITERADRDGRVMLRIEHTPIGDVEFFYRPDSIHTLDYFLFAHPSTPLACRRCAERDERFAREGIDDPHTHGAGPMREIEEWADSAKAKAIANLPSALRSFITEFIDDKIQTEKRSIERAEGVKVPWRVPFLLDLLNMEYEHHDRGGRPAKDAASDADRDYSSRYIAVLQQVLEERPNKIRGAKAEAARRLASEDAMQKKSVDAKLTKIARLLPEMRERETEIIDGARRKAALRIAIRLRIRRQ